jgi:protoporphyrinogen IX oxidase
MLYLYAKSFHIVFMVSWFAGLFYLPRLFIYHTEANQLPEAERRVLQQQFTKMERLLWNVITAPAMTLTLLTGLTMLYLVPTWLDQDWMRLKLAFVLGLVGYHLYCRKLLLDIRAGRFLLTSFQLRLWNEVATIFLVAIVFLVILKNTADWVWGVLGLFTFAVLLMLAVRLARRIRENRKGVH